MGRIIVIDGTSNVGKTTLCENLRKNVKDIKIIPGASLYAKMHPERYPLMPNIPNNADEEKSNQKIFFKLELDRLIDANKEANLGKDVFMDRGVFEILSVAYSFEKIKGWNGIYENALNGYNNFKEVLKGSKIRLPDEYIVLHANYEEIKRRNKIRQIQSGQLLSESEWIEPNLINEQEIFFRRIRMNETDGKLHFVDTSNLSKKDVLESICHLLKLEEMERNND